MNFNKYIIFFLHKQLFIIENKKEFTVDKDKEKKYKKALLENAKKVPTVLWRKNTSGLCFEEFREGLD